MKQLSHILLCSDLDGTLATAQGIPPRNLAAIERFIEAGGRFSVCSGRDGAYLRRIAGLRVSAPYVCVNGTQIYDPIEGRTLYLKTAPPSYKQAVSEAMRLYPTLKQLTVYQRQEHACLQWSLGQGEDLSVLPEADIQKAVMVFENEADTLACKAQLIHRYPDLYACRSWPVGLELLPADGHKGLSVQRLKEMTGATLLVAVGDYENDLDMLKAADLAYAPAGAHPDLLAFATPVSSVAEGAVADVIERLFAEYSL